MDKFIPAAQPFTCAHEQGARDLAIATAPAAIGANPHAS